MEGLKGFNEWDYSQGAVVGMADRVGRLEDEVEPTYLSQLQLSRLGSPFGNPVREFRQRTQ